MNALRTWYRDRSLAVKIVAPTAAVLAAAAGLQLAYLTSATREKTIAQGVRQARETIGQYESLRGYYAENVVARAKAAGVTITHDYKAKPGAIPLPATVIHDLGKIQAARPDGLRLRLYSPYPFPNQRDRRTDAFAGEAQAALAARPDDPVVRVEDLDGRLVVRVAVADRMSAAACVTCQSLFGKLQRQGVGLESFGCRGYWDASPSPT